MSTNLQPAHPCIAPVTTTREAWLQAAVLNLTPLFAAKGHRVPPVQVSMGFTSTGLRSHHIGECWSTAMAEDGVSHIFIVPSLGDPVEILDVLVHELVHAVDNCVHLHGRVFKKIARSVGLEGAMRSAHAGKSLREKLTTLAAALGPFPHGAIRRRTRRQINPKRPRARCPECGYEVPMLRRFLEFGPPLCPQHKTVMEPIGDWDVV
jgi:hypothetical protein